VCKRRNTEKYFQSYGAKKEHHPPTKITKEHSYKEWDVSTTIRGKSKQKPHV